MKTLPCSLFVARIERSEMRGLSWISRAMRAVCSACAASRSIRAAMIVAALVSGPALGADGPSLLGTWTGQRDRIAKVEGRRGGLATLVITQQQGNTFAGRLKRSNPTGDEEEPLWGAFTPDGQLIMGSDEEGTYIFRLVDQNNLDYCYSETGPSPRTVCARLVRQP